MRIAQTHKRPILRRSYLVVIVLSTTLLVSLLLNIVLFNVGWRYYRQLSLLSLNPLSLDAYGADGGLDQDLESDTTRVVFFGDSRAAQWPFPADHPDMTFINRGVGNQTSTQVLQRFDAHVLPLQPHIVVVQVGINDLKTIPLFPDDKDEIVAECKQHIEEIVAKSVANGATVILTTIFPIGEIPLQRRLVWSDAVALAVNDVNAHLRSLEADRMIVFDAYAILVEDGRVREAYAEDTLHLNATGYAALNEEFGRVLETVTGSAKMNKFLTL